MNKEVQKAAERGYLNAIDTRRIMVPMKHAALNRLLQSGGAFVMKYAMVLSERLIRRAGVSEDMAYGMIKYHDEEQWASEMEVVDEVLARGIESVSLAAKYLKLKVPLKASGKIGLSWAATH